MIYGTSVRYSRGADSNLSCLGLLYLKLGGLLPAPQAYSDAYFFPDAICASDVTTAQAKACILLGEHLLRHLRDQGPHVLEAAPAADCETDRPRRSRGGLPTGRAVRRVGIRRYGRRCEQARRGGQAWPWAASAASIDTRCARIQPADEGGIERVKVDAILPLQLDTLNPVLPCAH